MSGLFRARATEPSGPGRPSTFHEDPSERTDEVQLDYASEGQIVNTHYGPPDDELPERAVPVYQVEAPPGDLTFREWSPGSGGVTVGHAIQVASQDRRRTRLVVRNMDDVESVFVVKEATSAAFTGFEIPAGGSEEFNSNSAVWVCVATGVSGAVPISWFTEFDLDDVDDD